MPNVLNADSMVKAVHIWAKERLDFNYETLPVASPVVHYNVEFKGPYKGEKGAEYICLYLSRSFHKCLDSDYESTFWIPLKGGPCIWNPFRSWCDHKGHSIELRTIHVEKDLTELLDETCGGIIHQAVLGAALLTWAAGKEFETERTCLGEAWDDDTDGSEDDCVDDEEWNEEKKQKDALTPTLHWDLYYCTARKSKKMLRIAISTEGDIAPFEECSEGETRISNAVPFMNKTELIEWLEDLAAGTI